MVIGTRAVVLGGGLAGLLATTVLARHPELDTVTLVERDELPSRRPEARRGIPQGRHAHVLMSSGARIIERLLPGTTDAWLAAGAHRIGVPDGYVMLLPQGWLPRWTSDQFVISCSRALLDWVIRERVRLLPKVRILPNTQATGLVGDARRVTGVRVADGVLDAGFVVDATGRGSRARHWLAALGFGEVPEDLVDSGLRYATRLFRAPGRTAGRFPIVNVQADPALRQPGQTAALMPIEHGQWLVTLSGTRGGEPPSDEDRFVEFARGMRHPIVGDLIADAEPLSPVWVTNSTVNRRLRYDRLAGWPDGFVVLGDAVASYNPIYGHGMSVAAHGAAVLRDALARHGLRAGLAWRVQRGVARTAGDAWAQATGTDVRFPDARGRPPSTVDRLLHRYQNRLFVTALGRPEVMAELVDVFTLSAPTSRLVAPRMVLATLRGPRLPALDGPPFTDAELAALAER
jgi:2-polyprenyl-6-methoxyphenol hydroxylase-like FAD-dependent oxidoreductase